MKREREWGRSKGDLGKPEEGHIYYPRKFKAEEIKGNIPKPTKTNKQKKKVKGLQRQSEDLTSCKRD